MPDPALERKHLAKAERDIADGERRITRQMLLIEKMRQEGHDTNEADRLLLTLEDTLAEWRAHRGGNLRKLEGRNTLRASEGRGPCL